jgi:hypothetical protein
MQGLQCLYVFVSVFFVKKILQKNLRAVLSYLYKGKVVIFMSCCGGKKKEKKK